MTQAEFEQTPRFLAFRAAARTMDHTARARIMQEAIEQTDGEEQVFWLRVRKTSAG